MGYKSVGILAGGVMGWLAARYPIVPWGNSYRMIRMGSNLTNNPLMAGLTQRRGYIFLVGYTFLGEFNCLPPVEEPPPPGYELNGENPEEIARLLVDPLDVFTSSCPEAGLRLHRLIINQH
jgi:hypothetical protein